MINVNPITPSTGITQMINTPDAGIPRKKTMEFDESTISYSYLDKELTITTDDGELCLGTTQLRELHTALKGFGLAINDHSAVTYR